GQLEVLLGATRFAPAASHEHHAHAHRAHPSRGGGAESRNPRGQRTSTYMLHPASHFLSPGVPMIGWCRRHPGKVLRPGGRERANRGGWRDVWTNPSTFSMGSSSISISIRRQDRKPKVPPRASSLVPISSSNRWVRGAWPRFGA